MEKPFYEFDLTKEESLLDELEKIYNFCIDTSNYTKLIFRGPDYREGFDGHRKEFSCYDSLLVEYEDINNWLNINPSYQIGQFSLFGNELEWENFPKIHSFIFSKFMQIYGEDIIIKDCENTYLMNKTTITNPLITMYKKGGVLSPHQDGKPAIQLNFVKPANILLYLNKEYNKEWGGCFIVDGIEVVPEFGKLVFLNFRKDSDPEHCVSVVKKDINRIALLFSGQYSVSEKVHFNYFTKKKIFGI